MHGHDASHQDHQDRTLDLAILGSGVSGLAAALALMRHSLLQSRIRSITLWDRQSRIGGVISHATQNGYLLEAAAQGVLASRSSFMNLVKDSGIASQALWGDRRLRRFLIVTEPRPRLVALSPKLSALIQPGLLSLGHFLRLFCEPFVRRDALRTRETLYEFVARRFGPAAAQKFIIPLATGIWAGGASRLLVRHVFPKLVELEETSGSILWGLVKAAVQKLRSRSKTPRGPQGLVTFAGGMETFPLALHKLAHDIAESQGIELHMRLGTDVGLVELPGRGATRTSTGGENTSASRFAVTSKDGDPLGEFDGIISTVPLWRESLVFRYTQEFCRSLPEAETFLSDRLKTLRQTAAHGLVVVGLGGTDVIPPAQGFGALAPEDSRDLLGVIFVHSVAPEHAPHGNFLYRLMLGGDRDPSFVHRTPQECLRVAKEHLLELGLVTTQATFEFEKVFSWPTVIPLQDDGQDGRLQAIAEIETAQPGLVFAGNYLTGVGVHDCLVAAESAADRLARAFQHPARPLHSQAQPQAQARARARAQEPTESGRFTKESP